MAVSAIHPQYGEMLTHDMSTRDQTRVSLSAISNSRWLTNFHRLSAYRFHLMWVM
jgi:hypothetical protein